MAITSGPNEPSEPNHTDLLEDAAFQRRHVEEAAGVALRARARASRILREAQATIDRVRDRRERSRRLL